MSLTEAQRATLLKLARTSINHGLQNGKPLQVKPRDYSPPLVEPLATFVTLELHGRLRGCIGSLEAYRPLAVDIAENAFSAAFRDRRFPPLTNEEFAELALHISVLSLPEAITFDSEQELIAQLRPGIDGLILAEGQQRATFLPSVWISLPEPADFVRELKQKAGWPAHYWSGNIKAYRYTTETFA